MCGIVGVVGRVYKREEDIFKCLLQLDTMRGPHSTGVVGVGKDNYEFVKSVGTPWDLFANKDFDELMKGLHTGLIGHNRWATVGEITQENAHPFMHGAFCGVHNGTLKSTVALEDAGKYPTDSEMIYAYMDKHGVDETLRTINGAFALAFYNDNEQAIQLVRNDERPLWVCASDDTYTHFFASEPWMLNVVLMKFGVKHTEPVLLKSGMLMTIPCVNNAARKETQPTKVRNVEFHKEKTYVWAPYKTQTGGSVVPFVKREKLGTKDFLGRIISFSVHKQVSAAGTHYVSCDLEDCGGLDRDVEIRVFTPASSKLHDRLMKSDGYFKAKVKKVTNDEKHGNYLLVDNRSIENVDVIEHDRQLLLPSPDEESEPKYEVYNGRMVSLQEWYRLTEKGCSWCSNFPRVQEHKGVVWYRHNEFLCPGCASDPEVAQYIS